jgi:hypothetical protein
MKTCAAANRHKQAAATFLSMSSAVHKLLAQHWQVPRAQGLLEGFVRCEDICDGAHASVWLDKHHHSVFRAHARMRTSRW